MSKLFLDTNELRRMGMTEPNIRTLIRLLEFANTQAAVEEVQESVGGVTTDLSALNTQVAELQDADLLLDARIDDLEGGFTLDPTLEALAEYDSNGLLAQTALDTFIGRTLTGPAAGLTVTNGDGVAGDPTLALANDLAALEALSGTDTIYYRSGVSTWSPVTIGDNITFAGGELSASGGGSGYMPMVDGSTPPVLLYQPDGSLIAAPYP